MKAKKYLLFFLLGYCIYIAIEVTYRGYSFRLMGIAGGLSLAGIGMLEDAGLRRFPLAFQMMVSAVLITAIELYSGMFSLRVLHYRMWDYSALPFSFCDGLICPWFFGIWYLLSAVGIFLTDYVSYYIFHEGIAHFPVCIAKTQYSFSSDPKAYGVAKDFELKVRDIIINNGAEMIVVVMGEIMRMPGLPKEPQARHIDIVNGLIEGLS